MRPGGAGMQFAQNFELGQYLSASSGLALLVTLGCLLARSRSAVGLLVLIAVAGLWPMALTGHAAGTLNHDDAVNLQFFHLAGIASVAYCNNPFLAISSRNTLVTGRW